MLQPVFRTPRNDRIGVTIGMLTLALSMAAFFATRRLQERRSVRSRARPRRAVMTINRPLSDVYHYWRRVRNFPEFMPHLASVTSDNARASHWVLRGEKLAWDVELVEDVPETRIGWRSAPEAEVTHEMTVEFARSPGGRGTEVRVDVIFQPAGGAVGTLLAKAFGSDPVQTMQSDLRRLKQLMETGEVPTTVGQPTGKRSLVGMVLEPLEHGAQS
jgi:uncharacterized membrane protein